MQFLQRNDFTSYDSISDSADTERQANWLVASLCFSCNRIPILNKFISLKTISVELYLGQDRQKVMNIDEVYSDDGHSVYSSKGVRLEHAPPLDIDVGFDKNKYFLRVNTKNLESYDFADGLMCCLEDYFMDKGLETKHLYVDTFHQEIYVK